MEGSTASKALLLGSEIVLSKAIRSASSNLELSTPLRAVENSVVWSVLLGPFENNVVELHTLLGSARFWLLEYHLSWQGRYLRELHG